MKIERAWLRIIVAGVVVTIGTVIAVIAGYVATSWRGGAGEALFILFSPIVVLAAPTAAAVLAHLLTPRETKDGHTRCGKCGYILKGLTEPRCSECGERI